MGRHGFRVVYDHDGGRQRRMQREQGRTQSADSSSTGSTVLQLRQRRTDGGGISAAGYVCCIWVDPGGGNPKWEIPSRSNSFVFQSVSAQTD